MSITKNDLKLFGKELKQDIVSTLMIWMSQNFPTKSEVGEIVDEKLYTQLQPIKIQISELQDTVATLDAKFTEITAVNSAQIQDIKVKIGLD